MGAQDLFGTPRSDATASGALQTNINSGMLLNILQKLELGQLRLSQRADLQLQRLDELLQLQQKETIPVFMPAPVVQELDFKSPKVEAPLDGETPQNTVSVTGMAQNLAPKTMKQIDDGEKEMEAKYLHAYQGAMGWQKNVDVLFHIDPDADFITRFATGPRWTFLCIGLIILSTIMVAIETQLSTAHYWSQALSQGGSPDPFDDSVFKTLEAIVLVWMIIEVCVNAYAQRWAFICGHEWRWNLFDVVILAVSLTTQILEATNLSFLRVTRIARLFKLGKILRAFRVVKFLRSVRSMLISISGSVMHLLSALLVMCVFMLVVALIIMQSISSDMNGVVIPSASDGKPLRILQENDIQMIESLYGSLPKTMMTLFRTVSGGLEWSKAAEAVDKLGVSYDFIWTAYMAFMMFGLLNVLTGIFVDTAMSAMNNDRDNMIQAQLEERDGLVKAITEVFINSDTDASGMLNEQEMDLLLQDAELLAYLSAMGVDSTEAKGLFTLLDDDGSGSISLNEFVTGFLHLKGTAKAVDMVTLMYENRKISKQLSMMCRETTTMQNMVASLKQDVKAALGSVQKTMAV